MADWSDALRQATYQIMADSRPATLYWYEVQFALTFVF
jgi:hypothetical protein